MTGSNAPHAIPEQLIGNLLPVVELPTVVQVAETRMRKKGDIKKHSERKRSLPLSRSADQGALLFIVAFGLC